MPSADLILYNAKVYTLNRKKPKAQAIAIKGNKIAAVGSNAQILKLKTSKTNAIDLKGETVLSGFVDCHIHMRSYARTLEEIELRDVTSIRQLQQRLRQATTKKPTNAWITARGFDEEKFREKRLPTRLDLDKAVPEHPVFITRVCGHLSVANTKALKLANITKNTQSIEGGIVEKDPKTGEPTGILLENAQNLVTMIMPKPDEKELLRIYEKACGKAAEKGLTAVHCIIDDQQDVSALYELSRQNKLKLRVHLMIPVEYLNEIDKFAAIENDKIKVGSIKIFADGSLGAHTAALHKPYTDDKTTKGILVYPQKKLEKLLFTVHEKGYQLAVHAIGDRAIESVLSALEKASSQKPKRDHRHRIEHASVLNKKLIRRMKKLGIIASVQPHFIVSDFWTVKRLGERRARLTYALKSLVKNGVVACGGSDCPIEPIDPLLSIWAAVARRSFPQERLTVDEAIRMYTENAAFVSHEETVKGVIERGKLADLTVLAQDPYKIEADNIRDIKVDITIVDGEIVYARGY
ncbi:MAG TPA: amidohydrolase [Candidatus Krumholzibacteriaceae bacterium]|jgi:predicted amidohydrolase YtcJ|nr:amidohydrolase [Candidatus Krumholzibacteriaceae bacterium]